MILKALQGEGAPEDVHPDYLRKRKEGEPKEGVRNVNHTQRTPYAARAIRDCPETYHALMSALQDICTLVSDIIKKHLPDIHSQLTLFCDILPLNDSSATHPFPGCVINLQVSTEGHLDSGDDTICVVIPFGDFEDGELVLLEAGLIVDIREGDLFMFPSFRLTHFNMSFNGVRGSVVMHSDKDSLRWKLDRNGWMRHVATFAL